MFIIICIMIITIAATEGVSWAAMDATDMSSLKSGPRKREQ